MTMRLQNTDMKSPRFEFSESAPLTNNTRQHAFVLSLREADCQQLQEPRRKKTRRSEAFIYQLPFALLSINSVSFVLHLLTGQSFREEDQRYSGLQKIRTSDQSVAEQSSCWSESSIATGWPVVSFRHNTKHYCKPLANLTLQFQLFAQTLHRKENK